MLIEKRKKGEKTWEEISLVQMVDDINDIWTTWFKESEPIISENQYVE